MLLTLFIVTACAAAAILLYAVFRRSEQVAARPVEPPTPSEMEEGNVSPELPVAGDPPAKS